MTRTRVGRAGDHDVGDGADVGVEHGESWLSRNGWVLAAVWLVFLIFPLLSILGNDDIGRPAKVGGAALMAIFVVVYVHGFRSQHRVERDAGRPMTMMTGGGYDGRLHFGALITITVALCLVVGVAGLGVMSFLVAFAIFHFSWRVAWASLVGGIAITLLVAIAFDALADVWFLTLVVLAVGAAAIVIRNVETNEAGRSALRTQLAVSGERNRVARDVHDVLGHSLTAVILKAELCQKLLEGIEPADEAERSRIAACRDQLGELRGVSRSALAEIRSTVGGLRAVNLADEVTVARTVLADAGVELTVTGEVGRVPEVHRPLLAWVVREAVTNVVRHALAANCHIELAPMHDRVALRVSDDGVGIAALGTSGVVVGNGLRGLRERVEAAEGELIVRSDAGTVVEVAL